MLGIIAMAYVLLVCMAVDGVHPIAPRLTVHTAGRHGAAMIATLVRLERRSILQRVDRCFAGALLLYAAFLQPSVVVLVWLSVSIIAQLIANIVLVSASFRTRVTSTRMPLVSSLGTVTSRPRIGRCANVSIQVRSPCSYRTFPLSYFADYVTLEDFV